MRRTFFGTYQSITSWYSNWRIFNTSHSAQIVAHFRTMYPPNFSLMYRYGGVKMFKNRLRMYKVPIRPQFHVSQLIVDHNPLKKIILLLKKLAFNGLYRNARNLDRPVPFSFFSWIDFCHSRADVVNERRKSRPPLWLYAERSSGIVWCFPSICLKTWWIKQLKKLNCDGKLPWINPKVSAEQKPINTDDISTKVIIRGYFQMYCYLTVWLEVSR